MALAAEEREYRLASVPVALGVSAAVAAGMFLLARQNGGYDLTTWSTAAVLIWWTVMLVAALDLAPSLSQARGATVPGAALGLFAVWTGLSALWATSAEQAYVEFARAGLYLGLFVLGAILPAPRSLGRWRDGLAVGIVGVGVLALVSRLFPGSLGSSTGAAILPTLTHRLSYPMGYWNGLGILLALGVPLLLATAVDARETAMRAAAIGSLPLLAAAIYLTSSRGAVATAAVGALALLAAAPRRWPVAAAATVSVVGGAAAVAVVASRHALTAGTRGSDAVSQGHTAAAALVVIAVVLGAGWVLLERLLGRRLSTPSPSVGRATVAVGLAAVGIAIVLSHPVARFESFRQPPAGVSQAAGDPIASHLLSANGSGRWQFWGAAVAEFHSSPLHGRGAGSFEPWWAAHGSLPTFIRNAHSLYLEVLGELGLVGLLLLATFVVTALAVGVRRVRRASDAAAAALLAAAVGFLLAAGIDWMWQLTAVGAVGVLCLGLLTGSGAAGRRRPAASSATARVAIAALGVAAIAAQAPPLLSQLHLHDSRAAAADGRMAVAATDARQAHVLEPWAASPLLQLALVEEQVGDLRQANASVRGALARDRSDWRIWLVAARIETEAGRVGSARRSLAEARRLNPRSPIFVGVLRQTPDH